LKSNLLKIGKVVLLAKQTQVHAEKTPRAGVTRKLHEETWNATSNVSWQSVHPCGRHYTVFKNCRCLWNRSSWRSDLKIC